MFEQKKKELTEEQIDVLIAIRDLVMEGKIPFGALEPVYKDFVYSKRIEDHIKEAREHERQRILSYKKDVLKNCEDDVEFTKEKLAEINGKLADLKSDLFESKSKKGYSRDVNHIQNLLWWIFNNEEEKDSLESELKRKEVSLKEAQDDLRKFLEEN